MAGSSFGTLFCMTTWGETHGKGVGVVVDGCPAGLSLCEEDIQKYLNRRKPGQSKYTTKRKEDDQVEILSGVFEGKTTGTPISMAVFNKDQHSKDYSAIKDVYRPGHADYTFDKKYGFRDYRGGGRSSGRETTARVAAGAVAAKVLKELGIEVHAYTKAIGPVSVPENEYHPEEIFQNPIYIPSNAYAQKAAAYLDECINNQDSSGGIIECVVTGMPVGIGDTVFEKLDANLAKAMLSIGAVKGFEIGDGFKAADTKGSINNDSFHTKDGRITKDTNHAGGVLGGMSDGSKIIFRAAVKPTPSISQPQSTVTKDGENTEMIIKGRHDPVIVPRAVVVVESMAAITILDLLFTNMSARIDKLKSYYGTDEVALFCFLFSKIKLHVYFVCFICYCTVRLQSHKAPPYFL